ncbi:Rieske 2Fe-2S domain-containing protein [Rhodococcus sp. IEGM 1381]|uniref:Rieske (2Fe-2S) protein n=1 Tax=Rhodococcus sp. IEGM 1381 TaxID=3047085 RepID=UPI0024B70CE6|nr:Rieske 2Fe-2S domain-containing protein [Rhodococcus sp. IEGM 1381]MDI9897432.1 Rieske 2Fe-2S domain-containing protein [Rhodococcus sp. IEGM 1381]
MITPPVPTGISVNDLRVGSASVVDVGDRKILLVRLDSGVRATSPWCTHLRTLLGDQPVDADGLVECPLHGALFDTVDGSLQLGPTCGPLPVHAVEVADDGMISVGFSADDRTGDAGDSAGKPKRATSFGSW